MQLGFSPTHSTLLRRNLLKPGFSRTHSFGRKAKSIALASCLLVALTIAVLIHRRYTRDIAVATALAGQGSSLVSTACGAIEFQQAGDGIPLLVVHGSGGHDQGMAWARPLVQRGIRVIAMSRFGYLRTPMPTDASPEAQADAHISLLDALGVRKAAVLGLSAGGPSAMQVAIRHPGRVNALILIVPLAFKPSTIVASARPVSDHKDSVLLRLLGSDFLFWTSLHLARDQVIRHVLATPEEYVTTANEEERARIDSLLVRILPVSRRAAGLREDTRLGKRLGPYALESIRAPTLVVSALDDGFGTYASSQYTASRIPGARFVGFETGGHLLVGHDAEVRDEVIRLLFEAR